jgi:hypothetical protein
VSAQLIRAMRRLSFRESYECLQNLLSNIAEEELVFQPPHLTYTSRQVPILKGERLFTEHVDIEYQGWTCVPRCLLRLNRLNNVHNVRIAGNGKTITMKKRHEGKAYSDDVWGGATR